MVDEDSQADGGAAGALPRPPSSDLPCLYAQVFILEVLLTTKWHAHCRRIDMQMYTSQRCDLEDLNRFRHLM